MSQHFSMHLEDAATIEAYPAGVVSDDDDSDDDEVKADYIKMNILREWGEKKVSFNMETDQPNPASRSGTEEKEREPDLPNITHFDLNEPSTSTEGEATPNIIHDKEDWQPTVDAAQLLRYHQQFGHAPFRKIQELAKAGVIPKRLAKYKVPVCSACMFAKATRRCWRDKTRTRNIDKTEELT
eukprot:scaffold88424_cov63-Attheya_sp.AAC.1